MTWNEFVDADLRKQFDAHYRRMAKVKNPIADRLISTPRDNYGWRSSPSLTKSDWRKVDEAVVQAVSPHLPAADGRVSMLDLRQEV